jgi:small subunit ribosomal protein S18
MGPKAKKAAAKKKKTFFKRKKVCRFSAEHIEYIDYKDVKLLQQYILERAKILPRRISGNSARHQRMVQAAIKRARHLALIPYTTD